MYEMYISYFFSFLLGVMTYCIDSGTIDSIEEIPFDGKNWEDSIKKEIPSHS